jgi:hypothetical protein
MRSSAPADRRAHIDWQARTAGSSNASGRRQNASKNPSTQSPGVGSRSIRVRPPTARDRVQGREARLLDLEPLGQVLALPVRQVIELEREHHDRAAGDATQLGQTCPRRFPVVNRHAGLGRVHRAVVEGQVLGAGLDRGGRPCSS